MQLAGVMCAKAGKAKVDSFGDTIESIFDDMDPFPYNLDEDELKAEVGYSLGIEEYPKA